MPTASRVYESLNKLWIDPRWRTVKATSSYRFWNCRYWISILGFGGAFRVCFNKDFFFSLTSTIPELEGALLAPPSSLSFFDSTADLSLDFLFRPRGDLAVDDFGPETDLIELFSRSLFPSDSAATINHSEGCQHMEGCG